MSFGKKLGARLLDGAVVIAAVALAWKLQKQTSPVAETYPPGRAAERRASPVAAGGAWPTDASWRWWWGVLSDTYDAMSRDRLLAVAAGVVFYALLAIVPAITAFVSFYGLFAHPRTVQDHLALLADVMPAGSIAILQEQIARLASQPSGLSIGFIVGVMVALWSANAGIKALIDALNVIEGRDESRSFVRLNLTSLTLTLGAIVFLLISIGAVVAFPLVMSTFGLKPLIGAAPWLVRWPVLLAVMVAVLMVFYRFGPSRNGTHRAWLTPGVVLAALAWLAGSAALSFYLSNFADYNATYGSLGAAIGLMMWMWLSTIAVLIGTQLDTVIERRTAPTAIDQAEGVLVGSAPLSVNAGVPVGHIASRRRPPGLAVPRICRIVASSGLTDGLGLGAGLRQRGVIDTAAGLESRGRGAIRERIGPRDHVVIGHRNRAHGRIGCDRRGAGQHRRGHPDAQQYADPHRGEAGHHDLRIGLRLFQSEQRVVHAKRPSFDPPSAPVIQVPVRQLVLEADVPRAIGANAVTSGAQTRGRKDGARQKSRRA